MSAPSRRRVVSRSLAIATVLLAAIALTLTIGDGHTTGSDAPFVVAILLGISALGFVGAILTTRAPSNPIGPLFQVAAVFVMMGIFASEYGIWALMKHVALPGVAFAGFLNQFAFLPAFASILTAFLLFPDGHAPTRRWRPVAWLIWGGVVLGTIGPTLGTPVFVFDTGLAVANPLAVGPHRLLVFIGTVGGWAIVAGGVLAVVSVFVRFRRSVGEERQQLRWLAWAAVLILVSVVAVAVTGAQSGSAQAGTASDVAFVVLVVSILLGMPLATAIAVLRYRLYDLDLVVKKTAIYSIVAVVLIALALALLGAAALSGAGPVPAAIVIALTYNVVRRRARKLADRIVYGTRATPFEVLSEFSERVGETYSIDDVLPRMTQLLADSTGAREVRAWVRIGRRLHSAAVVPSGAVAAMDVPVEGEDLPDFGDGVHAFAVTHRGELLGAITLTMAPNDPMDVMKERLAHGVASQAGLALRNVRLVQDLRASRRRIVAAQDARAKALERNIHDGAQQQLVALAVKLRLAEQLTSRDPAAAVTMLRQLQEDATNALEELRDLARGIYPPLLADKGLAAALQAQARKAAIELEVVADGVGRCSPEVESAVYFCVLEALNNVTKYAEATSVAVALAQPDGVLTFEVRDDGRGFDTSSTTYGTGLQGMRDRLEAIGGTLRIRSMPGDGTVVRGEVPLEGVAG